jgi:hypothetical protein
MWQVYTFRPERDGVQDRLEVLANIHDEACFVSGK